MAAPSKKGKDDAAPDVSGVVLSQNVGWIDANGVHRWLEAGTRLDPVGDAELIAFLMRMGALVAD
jgi:hypothetical protein